MHKNIGFKLNLQAVILAVCVLGMTSCSKEREGTITLINTNAYETAVSLYCQFAKDSAVTKTMILKAGASQELNVRFNGVEPNCFIHQEPTLTDLDFLLWLERGDKLDILEKENAITYEVKNFSELSTNKGSDGDDALFGSEEEVLWNKIITKNIRGNMIFPIVKDLEDGTNVLLANNVVIDSSMNTKHVVFQSSDFEDSFGRVNGKILVKDDFDFTPNSNKGSVTKVKKDVEAILNNLNDDYIKKGSFEVINVAPYAVFIALWHQESRFRSVTLGWYEFEAGERRIFHKNFKGVLPNVSVYGHSAPNDANVIRNAFNLPKTHKGVKYFQPRAEEVVISAWINDTDAFEYRMMFNETQFEGSKSSLKVAFNAPVIGEPNSDKTSYDGSFLIQDFDFPFVVSNTRSDIEKKELVVDNYIDNAKLLSNSLRRRVIYNQEFPNFKRDSKYLIGLHLKNNDPNLPGVTVQGLAFVQNLLGQPMPFLPQDLLLELNGELVFSREDVVMLTNEHASDINRGVAKPMTFTLIRKDVVYEGETLYFYNPDYHSWPSNDTIMAFLGGVVDAITLGFDHRIYQKLSSNPEKAYWYIENKFRRQQFHRGYFLAGNMGTAIFSPLGLAIRGPVKTFLKKGIGKKLAGVLAAATVEGVENALWTYGNNHALYSKREFTELLKKNTKFGAGFGMAFASFTLIK